MRLTKKLTASEVIAKAQADLGIIAYEAIAVLAEKRSDAAREVERAVHAQRVLGEV